jgi:hypothetical protein
MVEVRVAVNRVPDLGRIEPDLAHAGEDDVLGVVLVVHGVEQDVAVVRGDDPRPDAGVAEPPEIVGEPLRRHGLGLARRGEGREAATLRHAQ